MAFRDLRLPLGFLAALLVLGVPCWRVPYGELELVGPAVWAGLVVLAGIALMLAVVHEGRLRRVLLVMGSCPAAVVMIRVAADTAVDPTRHNLWPFEVVFALVAGAVTMLPALVAGVVARRSSERASD
jgi:hypothetical protein